MISTGREENEEVGEMTRLYFMTQAGLSIDVQYSHTVRVDFHSVSRCITKGGSCRSNEKQRSY